MVVVKLVKSFSPLLSAIALGVSSLAFIVSFSLSPYSSTIVSPCVAIEVQNGQGYRIWWVKNKPSGLGL